MTDTELSKKITEAGGRVFIGFKDPNAVAGMDDWGRILASVSSVSSAKTQLRALGIPIEMEFGDDPMVVARISAELFSALRQNPLIEYIEPIFPGKYLDQQITWNVQRVNAPAAWPTSTGGGAILHIIDSGISNTHPDLSASLVHACDGTDGIDESGHGTAVAGIAAAANNAIQIVGASHGVSLWSTKIGTWEPNPAAAACAVYFGRTFGADVMNLSIDVTPHAGLTDQINLAYYNNGVVIVGAAGNRDGGPVAYPASLDAVIAVSATDNNNNFASFSSMGSKVELTAPGTTVTDAVGLTSTCLNGASCAFLQGGPLQGTSYAAPHVAAAAAILATTNYSWSNFEIRRRLGAGATDLAPAGRDVQFGYGLLNITGAIAANPPPLSGVGLSGPTMVPNSYEAEFSAFPVGGTAPFTYTWRIDGVTKQQSGSSFFAWSASSSYTVSVTVQDALSATASNSLNVTVCPGFEFSC